MDVESILGDDAKILLTHECKGVPKESLVLPGPDFIDRSFGESD